MTWPLALAAALMLGYLVLPFLALLGALPEADRSALTSGGTPDALTTTLVAATLATAADALLGVPLGLWLATTRSPARHVVTAAVVLPLAVPPVVGGLELILLLGPNGWLGSPLNRVGLDPLDTVAGTVLAQMFVAAPFVVISARAAFAGVDLGVVDAARSLGSGAGRVFVRVLLPSARQGIVAGLVLGWIRCLGEFGATAVVAYHPYTLPTLTYVNLSGEGLRTALPVGALLAAVGALAGALMLWLDARRPGARKSPTATLRPETPVPLAWIAAAGCGGEPGVRVRAVSLIGSFELNVAFQAPGGAIAILGPSGAGKSLTLRTLAGLLRPQVGSVTLCGTVLLDTAGGVDVPPERRRLGYVAQRDALFEHLDAEANIGFALNRLQPAERRWRIDQLLDSFGLGALRHARPPTMSGGERQRVALARALAGAPRALLLDEPFSSLDAAVRREVRALVRSVHERTGIPIVLVTHDREDVIDLADWVVVLEAGRVAQHGGTSEVFQRPASRPVARLVGIPNVLQVRHLEPLSRGLVGAVTDWGTITVPAPERPAPAWELAVPSDAIETGRRPGVPAVVSSVRETPVEWRLRIRPNPTGQTIEAVLPRASHVRRLGPDQVLEVAIDPSRCHLMAAAATTPTAAGAEVAGTIDGGAIIDQPVESLSPRSGPGSTPRNG